MGEVFAGRYELIDQIGQGGMGSVWRVHDRKNDVVLAAKLLRQADAGTLLRFMREQGVRIHHPNVVTPLGWAGEDDEVLFTMPLVDGGSVADLGRRHGPLPARFVAELLRQLLDGLGAVHAQRVVHRDVKPANLLLAPSGMERPHLWLTDFGVAVSMDDARLTTQPVVFGTAGYVAPEQLSGADPDPRSDLFAVGRVAAQLLTGRAPSREVQDVELPQLPAGTPPALARFVNLLCAPDPGLRPQSAAAARALLEDPTLRWQPQNDVVVSSVLPPLPTAGAGEFHLGATGPGTRPLPAPVPTSGATRVLPDRAPEQPRRRHPAWATAALIVAPLVMLGVLAAVFLTWPKAATVDSSCNWQDAGVVADGKTCTATDSGYLWK